jgi:hypothetical protein
VIAHRTNNVLEGHNLFLKAIAFSHRRFLALVACARHLITALRSAWVRLNDAMNANRAGVLVRLKAGSLPDTAKKLAAGLGASALLGTAEIHLLEHVEAELIRRYLRVSPFSRSCCLFHFCRRLRP